MEAENFSRIMDSNYKLSLEDVLRAYIQTRVNVIDYIKCPISGKQTLLEVVDTGEEYLTNWNLLKGDYRNIIVYNVALNEYDILDPKDEDITLLEQNLMRFQECFKEAEFTEKDTLIIYGSKLDLFADKLSQENGVENFTQLFPEFDVKEEDDFCSAIATFLLEKFHAVAPEGCTTDILYGCTIEEGTVEELISRL
eukprot:TRINITY_DN592_c0_g1_i2.p1 TRINITY_DN592_c0_g1~~TRINITY_DN592_c0_g1_i2.p1  ORF type:complete len:196 (+),score=49.59 TRINITY_DN592_c0_g1_i2:711-1298(+)